MAEAYSGQKDDVVFVELPAPGSWFMDIVILYMQRKGVAGIRLLIDGAACLLQKDHDPSKLFSETPCKLLRYLVENGSHVNAETPYAEVEAMKICMPLVSPASGNIQFK